MNQIQEIWTSIQIENLSKYAISNMGRVKHIKNNIVLTPSLKKGYYRYVLDMRINNKRIKNSQYAHILVAQHYNENPNNYSEVIHINKNKLDNKSSNLKWIDTYNNEVWEDFPYPFFSNYLVSNLGRIKNIRGDVITPLILNGYYQYRLVNDNNQDRKFMAHIIIADTFLDNDNNALYVSHIDNDVLNNNVSNLQWGFIDNINENWLDIKINSVIISYQISDIGRYRNSITGDILKPYLAGKYLMATMTTKNQTYRKFVHRLVAKAFVVNPYPKKYNIVNHIDGNKFNNCSSNLEWVNQSMNMIHAKEVLNIGLSGIPVIRMGLKDLKKTEYNSLTDASKINNISIYTLKQYLSNELYCNEFIWEYKTKRLVNIDLTNFKPINNFPNYMISNDGRIYSKNSKYIMKIQYNEYDYPKITLYDNGNVSTKYVHRLVAETFIVKLNNNDVVNHINGNKNYFHYLNLEWITQKENTLHSYTMKKKKNVLDELITQIKQIKL